MEIDETPMDLDLLISRWDRALDSGAATLMVSAVDLGIALCGLKRLLHFQKLIAEIEDSHSDRIASLRTDISDLEDEIAVLTAENEKLEVELEKLKK